MGVYLRCFDIHVTEKLLNLRKPGAVFDEASRKGMAKRVGRNALLNARLCRAALDHSKKVLARDDLVVLVMEEEIPLILFIGSKIGLAV